MRLQSEIWGFADIDLLPLRLFVVASKIGGQALGAFDGSKMAAFCLCIPGLKPGGKTYLHSHMLGVLPEYRNAGLGARLKLAQRDYALAVGLDLIEWTFDPLELKNAFFNIERLGAIARRYVYNQYGNTSSRLQGGLPTDRLVAEWWIRDERVVSRVSGRRPNRPRSECVIRVPADIGAMRERDPERARAIQQQIGESFDRCFGQKLAVIGVDVSREEGAYLLGTWPSK